MSSAGLANLAAITSANHAVIVCENEIMYCTAHTASATTATILRGQEGSTAASHSSSVAWVHGPVVSDFDSVGGYAQVTANQGTFTASTDLTSLAVTVTVPYTQHRYRISGSCLMLSSVTTDEVALRLFEGATQLQADSKITNAASGANTFWINFITVPTAASHTYKLNGIRAAGTGNVTMFASATNPAWIMVEDLGPAL